MGDEAVYRTAPATPGLLNRLEILVVGATKKRERSFYIMTARAG